MLEAEYQRAVLQAEAAWVRSVIADLRSGALTWSRQELMAFAKALERSPGAGPGSTAAVS